MGGGGTFPTAEPSKGVTTRRRSRPETVHTPDSLANGVKSMFRKPFSVRLTVWSLAVLAAASARADEPSRKTVKELHLPSGLSVNLTYQLTDPGGFLWDIQTHGGIGQGTNYIYSSGVRLNIAGQDFRHSGSQVSCSEDRREVELGPWEANGLRVYRRVRVYKELPLCRWLEVFENTQPSPQTIQVAVYTNCNDHFSRITTNTGGAAFGPKDWAFTVQGGSTSRPGLLHVVCDEKSKLRPSISLQGNSVYTRYTLTVPANGVAVLCHFQAQGYSSGELLKPVKEWKTSKILADLPAAVARLIVNFRAGGEALMPEIDRTALADRIVLDNGDVLLGELKNGEYRVSTFFGPVTVPADRVIGILTETGNPLHARFVLSDGQIIRGEPGEEPLRLIMSAGGALEVPLGRVKQCGYRITAAKGEEFAIADPLVTLYSGERLAFAPEGVQLNLRTAHGPVELPLASLMSAELDLPDGGVHRVLFRNGSQLAGIMGPDMLSLTLRLGPQITLDRQKVRRIVAAQEGETPDGMAKAILDNDDELIGRLTDAEIRLATDFGEVVVSPENVVRMEFVPGQPGQARLVLWDGSTPRGRLATPAVGFALEPGGPRLALDAAHTRYIEQPNALPPKHLQDRIEALIRQLGSEVFADRQSASDELLSIGPPAVPQLRRRLDDADPEIRQRARDLLTRLSGSPESPAVPMSMPMMQGKFIGQ